MVDIYSSPTDVAPSGKALLYYAREGDDKAYAGPDLVANTAAIIAGSTGPSGTNLFYLFGLANWVSENGLDDPYLEELARLARALPAVAAD